MMQDNMEDNKRDEGMYREYLLDYYKNPQNKGRIEGADIIRRDSNPLCGDEVEISIRLDGGKTKDVKFDGHGCVISMASASLLAEHLEGKTLEDIEKMSREDMLELLGLKLTPSRVKCAMLALATAKKGIIDYRADKND